MRKWKGTLEEHKGKRVNRDNEEYWKGLQVKLPKIYENCLKSWRNKEKTKSNQNKTKKHRDKREK